MRPKLLAVLFTLTLTISLAAQTRDYTRWVNPFVGTGGHGHTFPGAVMPFGMVQLSPDTRIDNWDGSSGYHYSDDTIYGFSMTHLSGTGIPDGCDILLRPFAGEAREFSKFKHADERAEPGYYSVRLDDGVFVELTATMRVGMHRYTFPMSGSRNVVIDLDWRDKLLGSEFRTVGSNTVVGSRRSSSWAKDQTVYFVAEFSKPFMLVSTSAVLPKNKKISPRPQDDLLFTGGALSFPRADDAEILVKVAISYVSIEGARKNLEAELPGWDFDKVRADAKAAWNKELSKIEVSGGTPEQMTTFYSALYHTMIHPSIFNDVDGRYRGLDGKVHQLRSADTPVRMPDASSGTERRNRDLAGGNGDADKSVRAPSEQYTVFSLWDTFRGAHPLYTIIDEKRTVDFINTFIRQYEQGGRLPVWELWGEETDTMIGYHAVSVIADAMAKGIKGFDYEKAYDAAKHSAELDHFGLAAYRRRGYISMEDENESVSKTLEYAYDDWCIAQMAKFLLERHRTEMKRLGSFSTSWDEKYLWGKETDLESYNRRARYFEDLFDPATGFMRPRKNGGFYSPFAPNEVTFSYTEGNAWVYTFFVPQDVSRLMELMGGRQKFAAKLDELFTTSDKLTGREQPDITGLIGQYAHGNEPSHHIAYLYDYAGEPWKTQKYVRQILDEFYKPTPDGLIGNEDCGQMSAWYILSASGFYPVTPGSPVYAIGTPLFPEVKYHLENGKTFTIRAKNVSPTNKYVLNAKLDGAPHRKAFITHKDIQEGAVLEFSMINEPVATAFNEFPVSSIRVRSVPVPVINGERSFAESATVTISTLAPGEKIYFTTDGTVPTKDSKLYSGPFSIDRTTTVRAIAIDANDTASLSAESVLTKRPSDWSVRIASKYSSQYTGGGDDGLIDGIRGSVNFASGEWQGYQGQDLLAIVDLKKPTRISAVGGGFLQVARSWIWMPSEIDIEVSEDGINFRNVADIKTDIPVTDMTPVKRDYIAKITPVTARYVRIHAKNLGKIPAWHPGAGYDAYIFVDEIIIR